MALNPASHATHPKSPDWKDNPVLVESALSQPKAQLDGKDAIVIWKD